MAKEIGISYSGFDLERKFRQERKEALAARVEEFKEPLVQANLKNEKGTP